MDEYDRMNPDFFDLLQRLEDYAAIDYGTDAYPISKAEAALLLSLLVEETLEVV